MRTCTPLYQRYGLKIVDCTGKAVRKCMANNIHFSWSWQQMHNENRGSAHPRVPDEYLLRAVPAYLTGSELRCNLAESRKRGSSVALWNFRMEGTRRYWRKWSHEFSTTSWRNKPLPSGLGHRWKVYVRWSKLVWVTFSVLQTKGAWQCKQRSHYEWIAMPTGGLFWKRPREKVSATGQLKWVMCHWNKTEAPFLRQYPCEVAPPFLVEIYAYMCIRNRGKILWLIMSADWMPLYSWGLSRRTRRPSRKRLIQEVVNHLSAAATPHIKTSNNTFPSRESWECSSQTARAPKRSHAGLMLLISHSFACNPLFGSVMKYRCLQNAGFTGQSSFLLFIMKTYAA